MSVLDKIVAAVTPTGTTEKRAEARSRARGLAAQGSWLAAVLDHHEQIEAAFDAVKASAEATSRRAAERRLAALLTGHAMAEEAVLYPAMALGDHGVHAGEAYTEQSAAKVNIAALEGLDPMGQDYEDKLEHVRNAVALHIYQEESNWFPDLVEEGDAAEQQRLSARYLQEFERYHRGLTAEGALSLTGSPGSLGAGSASAATTPSMPMGSTLSGTPLA